MAKNKKTMHLRLTIDVEYERNGESESDLKTRLNRIPMYVEGG